ncbi:MAG: hypothetical protein Q4P24_08715 [Rhodobacterales bacterium]|nr:hypothetical protein [Rhodobacterales bacterium]
MQHETLRSKTGFTLPCGLGRGNDSKIYVEWLFTFTGDAVNPGGASHMQAVATKPLRLALNVAAKKMQMAERRCCMRQKQAGSQVLMTAHLRGGEVSDIMVAGPDKYRTRPLCIRARHLQSPKPAMGRT